MKAISHLASNAESVSMSWCHHVSKSNVSSTVYISNSTFISAPVYSYIQHGQYFPADKTVGDELWATEWRLDQE